VSAQSACASGLTIFLSAIRRFLVAKTGGIEARKDPAITTALKTENFVQPKFTL
jgi:hypothetical protein